MPGIKAGDQIQYLDQDPVPATATAGFGAAYLRSRGEQPVRVALKRDGVDQALMVTPVMTCAIPINYVVTDEANAVTTADKIVVNSGTVTLARTDAQLAADIGHEMAHANLGHLDKKGINMVLGWVGGAAIDGGFALGGVYTNGTFARHLGEARAMAYSVEFEREADYVGAYYGRARGLRSDRG